MGVFTTSKQFALGLNLTSPWWLSGASIDLDFANGRYYDSSLSALKQPLASVTDYLSCTRASTAYAQNFSNAWIPFAVNQLRITDLGLLVESSRTNSLINSDTPATQTTASLATGSYTLWVNGSGSALASAGTATITGASSATDGTPNTFSVTVAGTVVVTVTGSLTRFQLEAGSFASSYISTGGTTVTRAADQILCSGTLSSILTAAAGSAVGITGSLPLTTNNVLTVYARGTNSYLRQGDAGTDTLHNHLSLSNNVTDLLATAGSGTWLDAINDKWGFSWDGSGRSDVLNNGTVATDANAIGTAGTPEIGGSTVSSSLQPFVYYKRFTAWNSRIADATLKGFTA